MIIEAGYKKALDLALAVIRAFIAKDGSIPMAAAKDFHELQTIYKDLSGNTL
jgi:hypothetical protein